MQRSQKVNKPNKLQSLASHEEINYSPLTFFDVLPLTDPSGNPILISMPMALMDLMNFLHNKGYASAIKGGWARRQYVIKNMNKRGIDVSNDSPLKQEEQNCDWDLITDAPKELIETYTGPAQNKHNQDQVLRFYNFKGTGRQLDIHLIPKMTLTQIGRNTDFCARGICLDRFGQFYDSTGQSFHDAEKMEIHSLQLLPNLFEDHPDSMFNLIETLVKFQYENSNFNIEESIERGMGGLFDPKKISFSDFFYVLKNLSAGYQAAKLLGLFDIRYVQSSLMVLFKCGLLEHLFPKLKLNDHYEWLAKNITERAKEKHNQPFFLQKTYIFEIFLAASLRIDLIDNLSISKTIDKINQLIEENDILRDVYNGVSKIYPNYEKIIQIATDRDKEKYYHYVSKAIAGEVDALSFLQAHNLLNQGEYHYRSAMMLTAASQYSTDEVEQSYLQSHIFFQLLFMSILISPTKLCEQLQKKDCTYDEEIINHFNKQFRELLFSIHSDPNNHAFLLCAQSHRDRGTYASAITNASRFAKEAESILKKHLPLKSTEKNKSPEQIAQARARAMASMPLDQYRDIAIKYFSAAYLDICAGKINLTSRLLEQTAEFISKVSPLAAANIYEIRAHLNNCLSDYLEAVKTWEKMALELTRIENPTRSNCVKQLVAWQQALASLEKCRDFFAENPEYFTNARVNTHNNTAAARVESDMKFVANFPQKELFYNEKIMHLQNQLKQPFQEDKNKSTKQGAEPSQIDPPVILTAPVSEKSTSQNISSSSKGQQIVYPDNGKNYYLFWYDNENTNVIQASSPTVSQIKIRKR